MSEDHSSGKSSGSQGPCIVCKHLRKKCTEECILKHYFGSKDVQEFEATQKIFGVSGMIKILKEIPPQDRRKAVESLVWESLMWKKDPVNGPLGLFKQVRQDNALMKNQINVLNLQVQNLRNYLVSNSSQLGIQEFNNAAVGLLPNLGNFPASGLRQPEILQGQHHFGYIPAAGNMNFSGVNSTVQDFESKNFNNKVRVGITGIQEFNSNAVGLLPNRVNFPVTGSLPPQIIQGQDHFGYIPAAGNMNFSGVNSTVQDFESRNFNNRVRGIGGFQEFNNNAAGLLLPNCVNFPATGLRPTQILLGQDNIGCIPAGSMNFNGGNSVQGFESRNFNSRVRGFQNQFGGEEIGSNFNRGNAHNRQLQEGYKRIQDNRSNPQDDVKIPEGIPVSSPMPAPALPKLSDN